MDLIGIDCDIGLTHDKARLCHWTDDRLRDLIGLDCDIGLTIDWRMIGLD